jgi:starch synthase
VFERFEPKGLAAAIRRAFALHARRTEWKATQRRAMRQDFGWGASAERYLALYRELA